MPFFNDPERNAALHSLVEVRYQLRRFYSLSESLCEQSGIGIQQYQLMQVIAAVPDGQKVSISFLAERMVLRHNSAVELVDRAEKAGLVKREHDASDMRRSLVSLTGEGVATLRNLLAQHVTNLWPSIGALIDGLRVLQEHVAQPVAQGTDVQESTGH